MESNTIADPGVASGAVCAEITVFFIMALCFFLCTEALELMTLFLWQCCLHGMDSDEVPLQVTPLKNRGSLVAYITQHTLSVSSTKKTYHSFWTIPFSVTLLFFADIVAM